MSEDFGKKIIDPKIGIQMHGWASDLYPICRSLSGEGVRQTLRYVKKLLPDLAIHEVASGTQAFDWVVPDEWNIFEAWIKDDLGNVVVDFSHHNLHVMGYSVGVDQVMSLDELQRHLFSLPDQPDLIPYVTSYYKRNWGFCLTDRQRQSLKPGDYHVYINSTLRPGVLNYGELVIPGETSDEILISTYVCHPSMANNELSGPVVACAIAQWLQSFFEKRKYTYRILFLAETIGSVVYLSRHAAHLKENVKAGFVLTCVGDDRDISYMPSRLGDTLADQVALHVLSKYTEKFTSYSFLERGSDERQYCSPNVDLPVVSIMRSKYGEYPEYHTSGDNLSLITPFGLYGALRLHALAIAILERNDIYRVTVMGEPQLGKRGLYPNISTKESGATVRDMMNVIAYCDGKTTVLQLAEIVNLHVFRVLELMRPLVGPGLLEKVE